ncbi:MAG: hypothetical protein OEU26_00075 [Candidatus Tectomicrobia bacterium]|nr:hypothetical protein [Candidatus Tectomicrobia bacterium]
MTRSVTPHVPTVSDGQASWWIVFSVLSCALLYRCGTGDVAAVTLVTPGTDVTPAGAADIATTVLGILANYLAPLGGLGLLIAAGASFARNRQSGITAGPAALAVGAIVMIFAPRITSELMTSGTGAATLAPFFEPVEVSFSPNPVFIVSWLAVNFIRRHWNVGRLSFAAK